MSWIEYFKGRELLVVDTSKFKEDTLGMLYGMFEFSNVLEHEGMPEDLDQMAVRKEAPVALLHVIDFQNEDEIQRVLRAHALGLLFVVARSYYTNPPEKEEMFERFEVAKISVYTKKPSWLTDGLQRLVTEANKRSDIISDDEVGS